MIKYKTKHFKKFAKSKTSILKTTFHALRITSIYLFTIQLLNKLQKDGGVDRCSSIRCTQILIKIKPLLLTAEIIEAKKGSCKDEEEKLRQLIW